jgi:aquaporin Z
VKALTSGAVEAAAPWRATAAELAGTALLLELVLTSILVRVILGTSHGARQVGRNSALAVGGFIAAAGLFAGTVTGASMNPARSLAPALVSGRLSDMWIYVLGPFAGALVAVAAIRLVGGRATLTERSAALGDQPASASVLDMLSRRQRIARGASGAE